MRAVMGWHRRVIICDRYQKFAGSLFCAVYIMCGLIHVTTLVRPNVRGFFFLNNVITVMRLGQGRGHMRLHHVTLQKGARPALGDKTVFITII
jgi:hypothetical protein